jgi:hypothetical protein
MGKRVPFGIVRTASTYLKRKEKKNLINMKPDKNTDEIKT